MILCELFDKPSSDIKTSSTPDKFRAVATIGNRDIVFVAEYWSVAEVWDVSFYEKAKDSYKTSTKMTGSGNEIQVMSTIKNMMEMFFQEYNPDEVSFSADSEDKSRINVYARMLKRFVPKGYTENSKEVTDSHVFRIERK